MINFVTRVFAKIFAVTNTRYVNHFVPVDIGVPSKTIEITTEAQKQAYDNLIVGSNAVSTMKDRLPAIGELNEVIVVQMQDVDNIVFTVVIKAGVPTGYVGIPEGVTPTFVLPLYAVNLAHLREIAEDGLLTKSELYRFVRVLFVPFLRGLYQADYDYLPADKSYLQLDNFLQVEVVNDEQVHVDGFPGNPRATVVNVDGQWLVFEGFQGDPDVRYQMTVDQALKFAYLIRVKLVQQGVDSSWADLQDVVKQYLDLKKKVTVYERPTLN